MSEEAMHTNENQPIWVGTASIFELDYEQIKLISEMVDNYNQTLKGPNDRIVSQGIIHQGKQSKIILNNCPESLLREILAATKEKPVKGVDYTYEI